MVRAAPVFSRMVPMMVPARITIPMLASMLPKPLFTVLMTSSVGILQTRPTAMAITVSTMNGCWLNLDMANTIQTTARNITKNINKPDIVKPPQICLSDIIYRMIYENQTDQKFSGKGSLVFQVKQLEQPFHPVKKGVFVKMKPLGCLLHTAVLLVIYPAVIRRTSACLASWLAVSLRYSISAYFVPP